MLSTGLHFASEFLHRRRLHRLPVAPLWAIKGPAQESPEF